MTSRYHGSRTSGSQKSFLTETAICIIERWKKSMGHRLCNDAQESHTCLFLRFSAIIEWPRLVATTDFATMVTWRKDFSCLLRQRIGSFIFLLYIYYEPITVLHSLRYLRIFPRFSTALTKNCIALSQSHSRNFLMFIITSVKRQAS